MSVIADADPLPTRVRAWGSVSHGMLTAKYQVTVYAPMSDTQVVDSGTGTVSGRRITA